MATMLAFYTTDAAVSQQQQGIVGGGIQVNAHLVVGGGHNGAQCLLQQLRDVYKRQVFLILFCWKCSLTVVPAPRKSP